ncbi:conserved hypothetical protein [Acidovorax delafieldii 2AN]|uniref:Uncharacterized protein n=1 Tax=Acidovorax delafieldii 2AN TaxID=573060 RepID=C5T394_ACIDE|nr:hypothetical protein [Acidovorax delafieldii]EER61058.1 conserved hypothetical protein [Acidovorax delafieldii 2AN]
MNRCTTSRSTGLHHLRHAALAALACTALLAVLPVAAQVSAGLGLNRPFPEAALRGTLTIASTTQASLNGQAIRMAPGMRLFSPQNALVMAHTVLGQTFQVNYVLEPSTGLLHAAWILTEAEAAQPRKGSDTITTNITTGSGAVLK